MKPMRIALILPVLAAGLMGSPVDAFGVSKRAATPPPASHQGQWYTTPDGCSYSRAKAPGYAVQWVLILNPHHIGQPNAGRHCRVSLQSRG
ncbi:hypothetical protein OO012_11015 [Rhodobacteraceae bacterium KMM 6894]|nr:hypothetical protein [Rhodobacteraceae bacterium KMM 6894]